MERERYVQTKLQKDFLQELKYRNGDVMSTRKALNLASETWHTWKKNPEFMEDVEYIRKPIFIQEQEISDSDIIKLAKACVHDAIQKGDVKAALEVLKSAKWEPKEDKMQNIQEDEAEKELQRLLEQEKEILKTHKDILL